MLHAKILHDNPQYRSVFRQHQRLQHQVLVVLLKNNELMRITKEDKNEKEINSKEK